MGGDHNYWSAENGGVLFPLCVGSRMKNKKEEITALAAHKRGLGMGTKNRGTYT